MDIFSYFTSRRAGNAIANVDFDWTGALLFLMNVLYTLFCGNMLETFKNMFEIVPRDTTRDRFRCAVLRSSRQKVC